MRQASRILAFVLIGLIAAAIGANTLLMAQLANTSTVIGTVTDASGAVAPGTAINLRNVDTGLSYQAQTDEAGQFRFLNVSVGRYELSAEKAGFAKTIRSTFDGHPPEPAPVDLVLKVGSVAEQVTVSGGNLAVVNTLTANEGNTITGEQVNTLPLTNRVF